MLIQIEHKGLAAAYELRLNNRNVIQFEKLIEKRRQDQALQDESRREYFEAVVHMAAEAGIIELDPQSAGDLAPNVIEWLATEIAVGYQKATTIPPE